LGIYAVKQLDIYFWREEDVQLMLEELTRIHVRSLLIDEMEVHHAPEVAPEGDESPLVKKLEFAVEDEPLRTSLSSTSTSPQTVSVVPDFVPAVYNPASPAAPEPIVYREKTPPPADAGHGSLAESLESGNHLSAAPTASSSHQHDSRSSPSSQQNMSFAPPPTAQSSTPEQLQSLFSPQASPSTPPAKGSLPLRQSMGPQPTYPRAQYATYNIPPPPPAPPSIPPQVERSPPGHLHYMEHVYSPLHSAQAQGRVSPSMHSPVYSQYGTPTSAYFTHPSYAASLPASPYAVHAQVYRPDEGETNQGSQGSHRKQGGSVLDIVDARAEKIDKGMSKWLKRLDK